MRQMFHLALNQAETLLQVAPETGQGGRRVEVPAKAGLLVWALWVWGKPALWLKRGYETVILTPVCKLYYFDLA